MSNRAAAVAPVVVAFLTGLLFSLSVRPASHSRRSGAELTTPELRWRVPSVFGTNLPVLGENILFVGEQVEAASAGRIQLEIFEPGEVRAPPSASWMRFAREKSRPATPGWDTTRGNFRPRCSSARFPSAWRPGNTARGGTRAEAVNSPKRSTASLGIQPLLCGLIGPETRRLVSRRIEGRRRPRRAQDSLRGPRWKGDPEPRCLGHHVARRRNLPGSRKGRHRRH